MITERDNPIVVLVSRMVSPFIMLFALYVVLHGHYSPGGGFQGGTMLAAALILIRLTAGSELAQLHFKQSWGILLGCFGVLIYFGTGFLSLFFGGKFLDYGVLHFLGHGSHARSMGILIVEIGVAFAVMGILVSIYDDLIEKDPEDRYECF